METDAKSKAVARESMDGLAKQQYLLEDANRKSLERSKQTTEEKRMRQLVDACRHLESRANESNLEHESRKALQNERQKHLLSKETLEQTKVRQAADSHRKAEKTAKIAMAYENSFDPNKDWNLRLNTDMIRHYNSRNNETDEKKRLRKEKDAKYQRNKRLTEQGSKEKRKRLVTPQYFQPGLKIPPNRHNAFREPTPTAV